MDETYDVIVVGGGAAGLSGALNLARARRRVLVADAGEQRNLPAEGVHGLLARDGLPPGELVRLGRAEVERYGGAVLGARVTALGGAAGEFAVTLEDGRADRATAARDDRPGRRAPGRPGRARAVG